MTEILARRELGRTGLRVTPVCVGTSPFSMPRLYGYPVDHARAVETVLAAFDGPINFLDTANGYGDGGSELIIGEAIRARGGVPDGFVLATKVDPDRATRDFSGDRVRKSVDESFTRLGLNHVPVLYYHDPERITFEEGMAKDGPVAALIALRDQGVTECIGVAGGPMDVMTRYVETGIFDVVISHNRYTLLDRSAEHLFGLATKRGMGVVNAAPYGGGLLAKGDDARVSYAYGLGHASIPEIATKMRAACEGHNVPLAAAALQFSTRDPRVHSTIVGMTAPERIRQTIDLLDVAIPDELWEELRRLAPGPELWIG